MKNSIIYTFTAIMLFIGASLIGSSDSYAAVASKKTPGAIVVSMPPACDCTAPANTCYCITADKLKKAGDPQGGGN